MRLVEAIKKTRMERKQYPEYFKQFLLYKIKKSDKEDHQYIYEALEEESFTKYYRFSVTAVNQLNSFTEIRKGLEMKLSLSLYLFWLKFADDLIDQKYCPIEKNIIKEYTEKILSGDIVSKNPFDKKYSTIKKHLKKYKMLKEFQQTTEILKEHLYEEKIDFQSSLETMLNSMFEESKEIYDIKTFYYARIKSGEVLADSFIDIMKHYNNVPETFRQFFLAEFRAGMILDSIADFREDYEKNISPKPSLKNYSFLLLKLNQEIGKCIKYSLRTKEPVKLFSNLLFSTYNIVKS